MPLPTRHDPSQIESGHPKSVVVPRPLLPPDRTFPVLPSARRRQRETGNQTAERAAKAGDRASVRMLARRTPEKRPSGAADMKTRAREAVGEHVVRECNDFGSARVDVPMHVPNEVSDPSSLGQIARRYDQDIFVGRAYEISGFQIVIQQLPRGKNRAGRQLEREHDTIRRFDQAPDAPSIEGTHGQLDDT